VKKILAVLLVLAVWIWSGPAFAVSVEQLQRDMNIMADELDNLKLAKDAKGGERSRVRVFGYNDFHYNNRIDKNGGNTEVDNHRLVVGLHAALADWVHFAMEIDFEHAAQEMELEYAQLELLLHEALNVRAGVIRLPIGFRNEFHEPNLYWSVERSEFQTKIIPTTFSAAGAGIFGTPMEGVNYRIFAVQSLQSIRPTGFGTGAGPGGNGGNAGQFKSSTGIRSGRLLINETIAEDFAGVGRLELTQLFPGLQLGFSIYAGNTTHDIISEGGFILLLEGDMKYRLRWFEMNASVANINVSDAAALNAFCASASGDCTSDVGDNIFGWNVQAGIHVPQLLGINTSHDLVTWFMFERVRPQDSVPSGTSPTAGVNFNSYAAGVAYYPIPEVAIKVDWQHRVFQNPDFAVGKLGRAADSVNLGIGLMY